jgi:hypothetical protein
MHVIIIHVMLDLFSTYALPGNSTRNVCWYFLTQSPSEEVLSPSPITVPKMLVGIS